MDALFEMLEETKKINSRSKMESGLLSAFHDDHFDGNYSKFDGNLSLWSDGNDGMGLQLSETLHGILPITANEEAPHFFETELEHRIPFRFESENDGLTETIIEMDKNEDEEYLLTNYDAADDMSDSMSPSIEIISVDPNGEFNSPVTDDNEEDDQDLEETDIDRCSSRSSYCSSNSSIADYESHSSDDESDVEKLETAAKQEYHQPDTCQQIMIEKKIDNTSTPKKTESILKSVSHGVQQTKNNRKPLLVKTNEIDKSLESNVADIKNFDLTAYIMQDNYDFLDVKVSGAEEKPHSVANGNVNSRCNLMNVDNIKTELKCDSDTEVIVDIETVHDNEEDVKPMLLRKQTVDYSSCMDTSENVSQCDDDMKHDPSWSPNNEKTSKPNKGRSNRQTKSKRNSLILQCTRILNPSSAPADGANKTHVVMDRKKYGLGKGKNISMCTRPDISDDSNDSDKDTSTEIERTECSLKTEIKNIKQCGAIDNNKQTVKMKSPNCNSIGHPLSRTIENKIPVNLIPVSEIKVETAAVPEVKQEIKLEIELKSEKGEAEANVIQNSVAKTEVPQVSAGLKQSEPAPVVPVKKKLNLEEYKRRRENQLIGDTKIKKTIPCSPIPISVGPASRKDELKKSTEKAKQSNLTIKNDTKDKPQPMYMENGKEFVDPILEAKKKVLRMQELRKAAQSKRIDSTVSAKVGPIMPILPMEQICGYKAQNDAANKLNAEYEEIIIVSASSNTEITLPPVFEKFDPSIVADRDKSPLSAVIKSSSLLSNINNSISKTSIVKISSNSLLSSIQDVVLKQSTTTLLNGNQLPQKSPIVGVSPPSQFSPQKPEMSHTEQANSLVTNNNENEQGKQSEHGEDKVIMHLRKDRIRKKTVSISIQTDILPQFPPLQQLDEKHSSSQSGNTKKRKRRYRSRRNSSASSVDNDDYRSSSRSHLRYRSVSSHGTNRSISPRSSRYSYSSGHRAVSPYRKVRRRSHRSNSRVKYASNSSDSDSGRKSRSRERRTRRYSSSHSSSSSSSTSSSNSSSDSTSRSRSRSPSPRSRSRSRSRYSSANQRIRSNYQRRNSSPGKAVEERRIVYVGRIERETSKEDLKRKFSSYGPIKQITVHYKDTGMKYGFVTFEKAQDAFTVIDGSSKDSRINMYDISFGGRRAFCRATYSDLDGAATNSLQDLPYPIAPRAAALFEEDSFESLLAKVKEKLSSARPSSSPAPSTGSSRCKT